MSEQETTFPQYVNSILQAHRGERICSFEFQGKLFWLKQPEKTTGTDRFIKPNPQKRFQQELQALIFLSEKQAPIPKLILWGDDFFVLEDAGKSVNNWIENPQTSETQKAQILQDCANALIALHQKNLIHGRPAIRDLLWQNGQVNFVDFESHTQNNNFKWQKTRDILVFLHSLCRTALINDEIIKSIINEFAHHLPADDWKSLIRFVYKLRWLYYMLLPFKPIAKVDLIAIYRLFENFTQFTQENIK